MISSPVDSRPTNPNARYYAMAETWKPQICTGLAAGQLLSGLLTAISISPFCIIAGVIQIVCSVVVLAIESPTLISPFLPQLQPIAALVENRPSWQKIALYSGLFLLPFVMGCIGLFFLFGQICALGVIGVYGMIMLGQKANLGEMNYQQGADDQYQQQQPAYSPTSP